MKSPNCPNRNCPSSGKSDARVVIRHGFYQTRWGKRRRYRCQACGKTFCSTRGTAYYRLQHRRATFDEVASLSVEGLNKSAIARVKRVAWNTVPRWLERAAAWCRWFNNQRIRRLSLAELQADEIQTIVGGKQRPTRIFVILDVWSRLWPSTVGCSSSTSSGSRTSHPRAPSRGSMKIVRVGYSLSPSLRCRSS